MEEPVGANEVGAERPTGARGSRLRLTRGEAAYVLAVAVIAALGYVLESPAPVLLAVLVALPTSVPALMGYYLVYGLLAQVPGANPSSSSGSGSCSPGGSCHGSAVGDPAIWFTLTTDLIAVVALTGAALLNVLLLRTLRRARRARLQPRPPRGR